ncbi:preprotein translocase subunit SecE [Alistipes sp. OttesenSCG-928-B03]|nr:preprotein translocase subunit SecE [Alistipes sp. OttesenSCG-928-B03]
MGLVSYVKNSYNELVHKVTWPSISELQSSAVVVMIASIIIALIVLAMDIVFDKSMQGLYTLLYGGRG